MDVNDLRALSTVLAFTAFIGIVWWAWHRKSQKGFEEAARLPFADDEQHDRTLGSRRE
ncbi:MAG: cytochrome oxidase [Burkholderiaceae bacterium]|jgi:cytochrome c oxidase cbb3-type subunit IV|nr:cytochrome oxidase [Burkholderiaceae bacterium]